MKFLIDFNKDSDSLMKQTRKLEQSTETRSKRANDFIDSFASGFHHFIARPLLCCVVSITVGKKCESSCLFKTVTSCDYDKENF